MKELPQSLRNTPELDRWVAVRQDGKILVYVGKVELGQGILTAFTLIAAMELSVETKQIELVTARTGITPNEGVTAGSMSIETTGAAIRQACAWARQIILEAASQYLTVSRESLIVRDGVISSSETSDSVTYQDLFGGHPFNKHLEFSIDEMSSQLHPKIVRIDLEPKVRGKGVFIHDKSWANMLHARVVRSRGQLVDLFPPKGKVRLFRNGDFIALCGTDEAEVVDAQTEVLARSTWTSPNLKVEVMEQLKGTNEAFLLRDGIPVREDVPDPVLEFERQYSRPYLMHGSIGPSAAAAIYQNDRIVIWCSSQGIELLKPLIARVLSIEIDSVSIIYVQGAGCYGHNGADDVTLHAALTAQAIPGRYVLLKWTREQEHMFEPYGPAMVMRMGANLMGGDITDWSHDVASFTHVSRPAPGRSGIDLLGSTEVDPPFPSNEPKPRLGREVGIHRNALPLYSFENVRVVKRFVPRSPLRTSALRSLGAHGNVFAIESFMDELAIHSGKDPLSFRLKYIQDPRARAVLRSVVELAGGLGGSRGLGIAQYKNQQCYAAVICEVDVNNDTAAIKAKNIWIAADAGRVVDLDGLTNQLEGGAIQALSWCLKEAVHFDEDGVTSVDWDTYPIIRFSEIPEVTTVVIDHPKERSLGAGEATLGPTAGALGNAVYAACGVRVRDLPMTSQQLRKSAAVSL